MAEVGMETAIRAFFDLMEASDRKENAKFNKLEHVLIEKVCQLFRNMLWRSFGSISCFQPVRPTAFYVGKVRRWMVAVA